MPSIGATIRVRERSSFALSSIVEARDWASNSLFRRFASTRFQVFQPRCLAAGEFHLPPREISGGLVLGEFLVEFLDREPRLLEFAIKSVDIEFVIPGIDFEEQRARLDELPFVA